MILKRWYTNIMAKGEHRDKKNKQIKKPKQNKKK
jgi:hypothetical protein